MVPFNILNGAGVMFIQLAIKLHLDTSHGLALFLERGNLDALYTIIGKLILQNKIWMDGNKCSIVLLWI